MACRSFAAGFPFLICHGRSRRRKNRDVLQETELQRPPMAAGAKPFLSPFHHQVQHLAENNETDRKN
jgi:hypothetical protein